MRLDQFSLLQHIIRHQDPARCKKSYNIRKPVNILTFGCVHKNQIIGTFKFFQDFSCISFQECDLVFSSCFFEILFCEWNSFFIIFNRCDMQIRSAILTHKKCGEAYGRPHFQNFLRFCKCQQCFDKTLHLLTDDRNSLRKSRTLQFIKKWSVACIKRIYKCSHSFFYDHEVTPSCSASPARIPIILVGVYAVLRR